MNPSLDYYAGVGVSSIEQAEEDWDWAIKLENGVLIHNTDHRRTSIPGAIVGYGFSHVADDEDDLNIQLAFVQGPDTQTVTLTKKQFYIADPALPTEEPYYPYRDSPDEQPPPNPWADAGKT